MTKQELQAIRARLAAAPCPPAELAGAYSWEQPGNGPERYYLYAGGFDFLGDVRDRGAAMLFIHAHADIKALLAEVDRQAAGRGTDKRERAMHAATLPQDRKTDGKAWVKWPDGSVTGPDGLTSPPAKEPTPCAPPQ